jgi:hypothetical protein
MIIPTLNSNLTNFTEKSSLKSLLNKGDLVEIANYLVFYGFTVIPLKYRKTIDGFIELDYTENKANASFKTEAEIRKAFSKRGTVGIAIRCGQDSNILAIDIDDPEKFERFYSLEKLKEEAPYLVSTPSGGYHAAFLYDEELSRSCKFLDEAGFELKSNGSLINFYTILADYQYTPLKLESLKPMPEELKEKIKELIAKKQQKIETQEKELTLNQKEKLEKILERLYELTGYQPKQRKENIWRGKCPCHDDNEPSLDIEVFGRRIHFKCWAGCPEEEIARVLGYELNNNVLTIEELLGPGEEDPETQGIKELIQTIEKAYKEKKERPSAAVILSLVLKTKYKFWLSDHEEAYISLNEFKHMKVESKPFKDWIQDLSLKYLQKALYREAMEEIISFSRHWARESKLKFQVFTRVGYSPEENFIEVNLLREDNKVLRITKDSIELDYPQLKFIPSKTQLPLNFDFEVLKSMQNKNFTADELLNLFSQVFNIQTKKELALLLAWMLKTFYDAGEYPILAVLGEREGVGKTTFSKFVSQFLDPTITPIKTFPHNRDDLFVLAKEHFLLVFDNLSHINEDISDALCQLSTGGSLSKRKLYTDYETVDIPLKRPIIINSIFNIFQKRDLRRRSIILELKKPAKTKSLKELHETFNKLSPAMYSYLVLCTQEALKEKTIDLDLLDLADFCEWVARAHPVFFMDGKEFIQTLQNNREEIATEILESNLLVPIIEEKIEPLGIWETTAKELLQLLKEKYPNEKNLPSTPDRISKELKKIASDLEAIGITVDFTRTSKKRLIVFYKENFQSKDLEDNNIPF